MTARPPLFFYGTLRHRPLLDIVLGPARAAALAVTEVALPGHEVLWARGECFPYIRASDGGTAPGLLVEGLEAQDRARLDFYEGGFLYDLRPVSVAAGGRSVAAEAYFPRAGAWAPGDAFDLSVWEERWGAVTLTAAREYMAGFGRWGAGEMAQRYPRMRDRAWSRRLAGTAPAPATLRTAAGAAEAAVLRSTRRHMGFFALDEVELRHSAFRGGTLDITREVFVGTDAALVLPYDPARDLVALLEQFRAGPLVRGAAQPWTLEPVAGLIDAGETPEDCAMREAREEAGLSLSRLVPAPGGYPSPGVTTEFYHLFVGLCDLDPEAGVRDGGGLDIEGEDIRTHVLPLDAALALIETGEIDVLPLAHILTWTAAHRDRLRRLA